MKEIEKYFIGRIGEGDYKDGSSVNQGWTYSPIPFPEFANVKRHKSDAIINDHAHIKNYVNAIGARKILDIGCANGYHSFKFASDGYDVLGIEGDISSYRLNAYLKQKHKVENVMFYNDYLSDKNIMHYLTDFKPDLVIMTNIHMWIHKQLGDERTLKVMKYINDMCKNIIFQTSHAESGGMYKVMSLKTVDDVKLYLESANFKNVKLINTTKNHRGIRCMFTADSSNLS